MTPDKLLPIAIEAVAAACAITRAAQQAREAFSSLAKDDRSPVTVGDYASQAIVAMMLRERLPRPQDHILVGEEDSSTLEGPDARIIREGVCRLVNTWRPNADEAAIIEAIDTGQGEATDDGFWTLDPVDGTKGFLRGQQFAIALAWIEKGRVRLGVMGCPGLPADQATDLDVPDPEGTIYAATEGQGAWEFARCDPAATPMQIVAAQWSPQQRIRYCGSVERAHGDRSQAGTLIDSLGGGEGVAVDSQCKYALVARGQADAYLRMPRTADYQEKIWDHAAGSVIATEAGAVVSDIHGKKLDFGHGRSLSSNCGVIVGVPGLHEQLIKGIHDLRLGPTGTREH